ncbi:MAG: CBASS cGAMP-activated phospholipase [Caldilineaceae bacterium]|nr:CBASS cGAMP-activated phospholipase [Caldilineaceae bacterium]
MSALSRTVHPGSRSSGVINHRRNQLPWPERQEFRILSIDGGGIKGIFPAAFLAGLEKRYLEGASVAQYFDLIAGTSTGGIIALGLGAGHTAAALGELYLRRGREIFPPQRRLGRLWGSACQLVRFRYGRNAISRALDETFGQLTFGESTSRLCIPSFDGRHSDVYVFKTPHHPDYKLDGRETMSKVAAATSAAPTYFRPVDDGGFTFVDGGVWCNNPVMVGLVDALTCFAVPRERIRILSVGCGDNPYTVGAIRKKLGGMLAWKDIIFAAMRFQSLNALGQAGLLIGADRIMRVDAPLNGKPIELDDWRRASSELPPAASAAVEKYGETVASLFLQKLATPYVPHSLGLPNGDKPGIKPGTGDTAP